MKWTEFDINERKAMIQGVVAQYGIDEAAAEKDWWVTAVLYAVFHTSVADYLLFKGGTSLSKGWNIINRFSEDIDLALDREFFIKEKHLSCAQCENNTQMRNLRKKAQDYFFSEFKEEVQKQLQALGLPVTILAENEVLVDGQPQPVDHDKDPSVLLIRYPSLFTDNAPYAQPTVKLEISVLSMAEPFEMKTISSLISAVYPSDEIDIELTQTIRTASPARTFLEKAFLLCEEYQKPQPRTYRMTRHFYDLEKLMQTDYAHQALNDAELYLKVVEHRKKFYHVGAVDYEKELPHAITIVPPTAALRASFADDYNQMRQSFIYGTSLDFDALMLQIETLQDMFHAMKTNE